MTGPTRKEWLAALKRANAARRVSVAPTHSIVEAALGPCPPKPAPEPFRIGEYTLVNSLKGRRDKVLVSSPGHTLTPNEADAMACSLIEHAAYAREQGAASDA